MRTLSSQFRNATPVLLISWIGTLLALLLVIFISSRKEIALDTLTKDPLAILNASWYLGMFSNLGIMTWSGAVAICWFSAYRIYRANGMTMQAEFMMLSGLISLLMGLDDLFQLHELVLPHYFAVSENTVYLTYLNIYLLYFIRHRTLLMRSEYLIFGMAFVFLGLSTLIKLFPMPIPQDTFLKDALKLFGIVTWFIYFFRAGNELLDKPVVALTSKNN